MKAQAFLELVGEMLTVQQDYFQAKRDGLIKAKDLLVKAKGLEKRVSVVVKEGKLEPDFMATVESTSPGVVIYSEEEFREQMKLFEDGDVNEQQDT